MKVDLQSPVDLVVGTPGTLLQFCEKGMEPSEVLTKFIICKVDLSSFICLCIYPHSETGNI